jgi:hypothetical protein
MNLPVRSKEQILESLNTLDAHETEKVLALIKSFKEEKERQAYQKFKREALTEIRQALSKKRKRNPFSDLLVVPDIVLPFFKHTFKIVRQLGIELKMFTRYRVNKAQRLCV